jgi:enoyl-CoA hydratase/carnithine racemase
MLDITTHGSVLTLTLDRPEKKNALNTGMYQALINALVQAESDSLVKAVILTGVGGCFCAGHDLAEFASLGQEALAKEPLAFLHTLARFKKPLLASVEGDAIGIGTSLLLHCDLVVAHPEARFQLPFTRLGLVPEGGTSLLLPERLGHQKAFELLVLGKPYSGVEAERYGLINQCSETPLATVQALADEMAQLEPMAVQMSKALLKQGREAELTEWLDEEVDQFVARLKTPEAQAVIAQFFMRKSGA